MPKRSTAGDLETAEALMVFGESLRDLTDLQLSVQIEKLAEDLAPLLPRAGLIVAEAGDRLRRARGSARGPAEFCMVCGAPLPEGHIGVDCILCAEG